MKTLHICLLASIITICAPIMSLEAQPTTYIYTGQYFSRFLDFPDQPFNTSDRVVGELILPNPLPANFSTPNVSTLGASWYFSDGVGANSWNWPGGPGGGWFQPYVSTDANGNIVSWNFILNTPVSGGTQWLVTSDGGDAGELYDPPVFGNQYADPCAWSEGVGSWTTYTRAIML